MDSRLKTAPIGHKLLGLSCIKNQISGAKQMPATVIQIRKAIKCLIAVFFIFLSGCAGNVSQNYQRGAEALNNSNYDEAIGYFTAHLTSKPDDADAHLQLGLAYLKKESLEEAIEEFKKSVALKQDKTAVLSTIKQGIMEKVTHYSDQGKTEVAMRYLTAHLAVNPDDLDTHILLAKSFIKIGSTRNALLSLNKAVALDPKNPEVIELLDYFADGFH